MATVGVILVIAGCGDNEIDPTQDVPFWEGADRLATTACAYGGTATDAVAVDDFAVYWSGGCGGELYKTPLGGGAATTLATGADRNWCVHGVQLDGDDIAFTTGCGGTVEEVAKSGGATRTLWNDADSGGGCIHGMVGGDDGLYVTTGNRVLHLPAGGGAPEVIAADRLDTQTIALRSDAVFWIDAVEVPGPTISFVGNLETAPRPSGAARFVTVTDESTGFGVTDDAIVFGSEGHLVRLAADQTRTQLATLDGTPSGIAIADHTVYWLDNTTLSKVDLDGGPVTVIARTTMLHINPALALDASRVYWTDGCGMLSAPR